MDSYIKIFDRRPQTSYFRSGDIEYTAWKNDYNTIKYTESSDYSFEGEGEVLSENITSKKDISVILRDDSFFILSDNGETYEIYSISGDTQNYYNSYNGNSAKLVNTNYFSGNSIAAFYLKDNDIYARLESDNFSQEYYILTGQSIDKIQDVQPLLYPQSGKIGIFCYKNGTPVIFSY